MSIKFACECGKAYKVPEKYAGKRVRCKNCGETVAVPSESSSTLTSARAAAVSQRSVMGSGRHAEEEDEPEESGEDEGDEDEKPRPSGSSARNRAAATAAGAVAKPPQRRPGGDTQEFEPVDLTPELKRYQKKRDDESLGRGVGKLTLFEEGKPTKAWKIEKTERSIGRSERCDIKVPSKTVSKEHVRLEYKLGTYIATDQNSLNGVVVNAKKVRRASLRDGDLIQLGDVVLRFEVGK
jgi:hypothetical protein